MILLYSAIGVLIGVSLVGIAIWFGIFPSLSNRKSRPPEPSGNSTEPNDSTNICGTGND